MSDTTTDDGQVPVEYADPEPDEETGGDAVQMVPTGWIRFVIGDTRIRFRPPRFGELRRLMEALDELTETIDGEAERVSAEADVMQADHDAFMASDATAAEKAKADRVGRRKARDISRGLVRFTEEQRVAWWRVAHETLGVSGEQFPADEDVPIWLLDPTLIQRCSTHWRSVPLDRGKRPKQGT